MQRVNVAPQSLKRWFECEKSEDESKELVRKQKSIKYRNSETKDRKKGVSNVILVFKRDKTPEQDIVFSLFCVDCVVTHSTSVGGGNAPNRRLSTQKKRTGKEEEV